ncbi:MAG: peptidase S41, partial [Proteobacteria bacterium]|nr:peptidase S41 [Pseudomonadota bacterium]
MKKLFLGIIGGACAAFALTVYFNGSYAQAQDDKTYHQLGLFGDVFERIRSTYVEEIDEEELIESALNGMLS